MCVPGARIHLRVLAQVLNKLGYTSVVFIIKHRHATNMWGERIWIQVIRCAVAIGILVARVGGVVFHLLPVRQVIAVGVRVERIDPEYFLLTISQAIAIGVWIGGIRADGHFIAVREGVAIGIGIPRISTQLAFLQV